MENQSDKIENTNSALKSSIIAHLTNEISTITTLRNSWRNQVMSLIYIGPFLLISSALFGKTTIPKEFKLSTTHWFLIVTAFVCWVLLGLIAGLVEFGIWKKCNEWRGLILQIISDKVDITQMNPKLFLHDQSNPPVYVSYLIVYVLLGTILFCVIYLAANIFFYK